MAAETVLKCPPHQGVDGWTGGYIDPDGKILFFYYSEIKSTLSELVW